MFAGTQNGYVQHREQAPHVTGFSTVQWSDYRLLPCFSGHCVRLLHSHLVNLDIEIEFTKDTEMHSRLLQKVLKYQKGGECLNI